MYTGKTLARQHENIARLFEARPKLNSFFGTEWSKQNLLFADPVEQNAVHPLFFALANEMRNERLARNLKFLQEHIGEKFSKLCTRLKNSSNRNQLESCLNEIEAFVFIRNKFESCIWEPPITNSQSKADIGFKLEGKNIYVEIVSIFSSESDEEIRQTELSIQSKINQIPNNHYCIGISYEWPFFHAMENEDLLIQFIANEINSSDLSKDPNKHIEKVFEIDGTSLAEVSFSYVSENEPGFLGTYGGPGGARDDSSRIKHRLMSKMQKFQLPTDGSGVGGYLVFLNNSYCDFLDFRDALYGRETATFFSDGRPSVIGTATHESLCNTEDARKKMQHIHFFVVIEDPSQYWFSENVKVFTNNEGSIAKESLTDAFTTQNREVDPYLRWVA